ncbi:MAG: hypothetical protein AAGD25_07385 [Cyanobacteria bacterium P01_F01_bin.150]
MSLAIAEAIVPDDSWPPESLANRFVDVFIMIHGKVTLFQDIA